MRINRVDATVFDISKDSIMEFFKFQDKYGKALMCPNI